ncbi:MAG: ABC transporter substrate-binding protein [Kangiellaceae bacterium]|nr:ABC transporter substrate-binding protein [Kangiellaceae bacterium]MCW8998762.1 ABC transporter substrate-binding protein [Kangiellaceae bacterium]MCW9015504.1 ABC transporter substrate-binding protein [Kangiellaceae bacterium]
MNSYRLKRKLCSLLLILALLAGCGSEKNAHTDRSKEVFKVGVLAGLDRAWEHAVIEGLNEFLAIDKTPFECKYKKNIQLFIEDTYSTPEGASQATNHLIFNTKVDFLLGPNLSSAALPAANIAQRAGVPMLSILSSHHELTTNRPLIFQMISSNKIQARVLTKYIKDKLNFSSGAIVYGVTDIYSRSFAEEFRSEFLNNGVSIKDDLKYTDLARDTSDIIDGLTSLKIDFVFLPNKTEDVIFFANKLKEHQLDVQIIGTDYWQVLDAEEIPSLQGALIFDHWHHSLSTGAVLNFQFENYYQKQNGQDISAASAMAFDAMGMLVKTLCNLENPSKDAVVKELTKLEFAGISGKLEGFTQNRANRPMVLIKIEDSKTRVIDTISMK